MLQINSSPSRAAKRDKALASLALETAGTYSQHFWMKGMLPFIWNHCKTLHTSILLRNQKSSYHRQARTDWWHEDTYLWSFLCGEADPSSGAKKPKCIQLYYPANWERRREQQQVVKGVCQGLKKVLAFCRSSLFTLIKFSSTEFTGDFYHCISPIKLHLRSPLLLSFHAQHDSAQYNLIWPV